MRVEDPKTPEGLRASYRLMATHWQIMRQVYPDRRFVAGYDASVWDKLITHLLGQKVWGYRSRANMGLSWEGLLEFEFQIRQFAMTKVSEENFTLNDALKVAMFDPNLENRFFTLELVTSGERRGGKSHQPTDEMTALKRTMEQQQQELKRLRTQISKSKGKGSSSSSGGGGNQVRGRRWRSGQRRRNQILR